jgi:hypothetical protein
MAQTVIEYVNVTVGEIVETKRQTINVGLMRGNQSDSMPTLGFSPDYGGTVDCEPTNCGDGTAA